MDDDDDGFDFRDGNEITNLGRKNKRCLYWFKPSDDRCQWPHYRIVFRRWILTKHFAKVPLGDALFETLL